MITSMTTIDFLEKYGYDPDRVTICVRKVATVIGGTTASLILDEVYTIS